MALRACRSIHKLQSACDRYADPFWRTFGTSASRHVAPSSASSMVEESVDNETIAGLASRPLHELKLADLVRHGRPPLSTPALLSSANFALSLIPVRLAHRLRALRNLPFIVVSNPNISKIYNNYMYSLSMLLPYSNRTIQTLEEEVEFTEFMAKLVETHANTIPILAQGFLESRRYVAPKTVTKFLDDHLRARIGTRLIAEQHIALHLSSQPHCPPSKDPTATSGGTGKNKEPDTHIGVIDTALRPAEIVSHCESFVGEICELRYGVRPSVVVNGQLDTKLAHVPTHLEYILTELLKNAFRATVENGKEREAIEVTIAASKSGEQRGELMDNEGKVASCMDQKHTEEGSLAIDTTPSVTIRIRDRGGGIPPTHFKNIWAYSFTTFNDDEASSRPSSMKKKADGMGNIDALNTLSNSGAQSSSLAGLGYGLPLGRAYAEHFGGSIALQSLWGWGTDVYLKLKGLGDMEEP